MPKWMVCPAPRKLRTWCRCLPVFSLLLLFLPNSLFGRTLHVTAYEGVINPVASEWIATAVAQADRDGAEALIIQLDTPGGLDTSMRDIVRTILASPVPVIVYVAPSGGRAASAGVFIAFAAHLAAMAPGTNIGAAHPVAMGGKAIEAEMKKKLENDAAAYLRSLAERRGRDVKWAEEAVIRSASLTEKEALQLKVVDFIADDLPSLIRQMDGRTVTTIGAPRVLSTVGATIIDKPMPLRLRILKALSDPNVAYVLMLLGTTGLIAELYSPGAIFPGVVGSISLLLAFYAFQTLPVNYAGFLLILLAFTLFIAEIKVPSFGVLGSGGVISLLMGSLMLVDRTIPSLQISLGLILPTVTMTAVFFFVVVRAAVRSQRRPVIDTLIGAVGRAEGALSPQGIVQVRGEIWQAESVEPVAGGEAVEVVEVVGFQLRVKKMSNR